MGELGLYVISFWNGVWAFIHFLIIPILSFIGAYYLFCYYAGFRLIEWTKEMEIAERKAWINQLDRTVRDIEQRNVKWQAYKKQQNKKYLEDKID